MKEHSDRFDSPEESLAYHAAEQEWRIHLARMGRSPDYPNGFSQGWQAALQWARARAEAARIGEGT